jgi:hypothetical protein
MKGTKYEFHNYAVVLMVFYFGLRYGFEDRGSFPGRGKEFLFFSAPRPDRL